MPPLREQMLAALQRSGKGKRPQQAYVRAVRLLTQGHGTSPALISAPELQADFLHRKNLDRLAPASMRICYSGIRCVYQHGLKRAWHTLSLIRAHTEHRLPAVLRAQEVRRLLKAATPRHTQVYGTTVSTVGRRRHEGRALAVAESDGQRLQVQVHRGKGAKDRDGPLPQDTLTLWRASWRTHRQKPWLLPATERDHKQAPSATSPTRPGNASPASPPSNFSAASSSMGSPMAL